MVPQKAMVVVAHPDDAEFLAAGTVAAWTGNGCTVVYVIATDGDKGSDDPNLTSQDLIRIRKEEQQRAAARLGVAEVVFLGYEDSMLEPTLGLRRDITRVIRRYQPVIVITFDPTNRFITANYPNHPDHRAAGDAAVDAVFPASRDRLTFPELLTEGLQPHKVEEIWLGATREPNHWVDIEATLEVKVQALRCHDSQLRQFPLEEFIPAMAKYEAQGSPHAFAESFRRIVLGGA